MTLHDGQFDAGGPHIGETLKTTIKNNAGGNANWNEKFVLNKPEHMDVLRFQLYDSDNLNDDYMGSIDLDLNKVIEEGGPTQKSVSKTLELVNGGKPVGKLSVSVKITA
eukprot:CAMPEP_0172186102 /NCGR_PEP_ID=MMETSP1050-20130122/20555_1 /TAXON_ID=233186 /ORGANISM="Cryptomonas curvata, Strain CCAP979/52" /LENGTH=108 /DNA_ID=CAMNT_0012860195 /DNA_START=68 /DNA_END=394 /DNA_ORIENTATION=-